MQPGNVLGGGNCGSADNADSSGSLREPRRAIAGEGGYAGARDRDSDRDWGDAGSDIQATGDGEPGAGAVRRDSGAEAGVRWDFGWR